MSNSGKFASSLGVFFILRSMIMWSGDVVIER